MNRFKLSGRERNFFDFEAIFFKNQHTGYVRPAGKDLFQLVPNPLLTKGTSNNFYRLPSKTIAEIDPNASVKIIVGEKGFKRDSFFEDTTIVNTDRFEYRVEGIEEFEFKVGRPHIDMNDYLALVTDGWKYQDEDFFDLSLGLQLLSSPQIDYARSGGIGGKSFFLDKTSDEKGLRTELRSTLYRCLPWELHVKNPWSYFRAIETRNGVTDTLACYKSRNIAEVSYSILKPSTNVFNLQKTGIPPTVPTLLRNAIPPKKSIEYDTDVIEYVLKARLHQPSLDEEGEKVIKKLTVEINDKYGSELADMDIFFGEGDVRRTALSMCRLDFTSHFQSRDKMKKFIQLIKMTVEFSREVHEARKDSEGYYRDASIHWPSYAKIVFKQINDIFSNELRGTNLEELLEALGERASEKEIIKALELLKESGQIYYAKGAEDIRPT
ncbi:MAG: hypothetical protein ISF22_10580 [Methanomassiliicoccus sp.]|nr:hypothetical protein [Methanomassiliicoccus sp.]